MKKIQLTKAGEEFVKRVKAYPFKKLDVTKPYKATPAVKPAMPKPPRSGISLRMNGEDMIPGKPIDKNRRDALRKDYLFGTSTNEELAEKYGVHPNTIYNLAQRESWGDLKEMLALNTQIVALGEKLIQVIKERLGNPDTVTVSMDEPLPASVEEDGEEEVVEVPYTLDTEAVEEDVEEEEEPDDDSIKWSF